MSWKEDFLSSYRIRPSRNEHSTEVNNPDKRNAFESDYGRVVFSSACRRLHDKTQVFPLTTDDSIHSRLTHSMEVMNLGYSLAVDLIENKDFIEKTGVNEITVLREVAPILKTACLVHDIGNPPFGHFGEEIIKDYFKKLFEGLYYCMNGNQCASKNYMASYIWKYLSDNDKTDEIIDLNNENHGLDYTEFDGNAQGFRVLTKLQYAGDSYGLNLTKATLGAILKYPNCGTINKDRLNCHKHGVFTTESDFLEKIYSDFDKSTKCASRHPLSFLVEASDSICYYTMDIEDANRKKWIDLKTVIKKLLDDSKNIGALKDKLNCLYEKLQKQDCEKRYDWLIFRNLVLSHMVGVAIKNFVSNIDDINAGNYNHELIEDNDDTAGVLKSLSREKIISHNEIVSLEVTGKSVIEGIFNSYFTLLFHSNKHFRNKGKALISKSILRTVLHEHLEIQLKSEREKYDNELDFQEYIANEVESQIEEFDVANFCVEEKFRLVRDFVSGMTDKFALNHYQKLSGQNL